MSHVFKVYIFAVVLLFALPVMAADYTVQPLAFNYNVERRDIISESILLTNTTDRSVRVYASVHEVATDGQGVVKAFSLPEGQDKAVQPASWIEITRARIVLDPGEQREIPFTVRMSPYTEPGEYSVFIGFAKAANQPQAVEKIMAGETPGTLINLIVDKKQNQSLRLDRFFVDRFAAFGSEQKAILNVSNPEDVTTTMTGEIIIYDNQGYEVAAVPLAETARTIAHGDSAEMEVPLPDSLPMGRYKAYLAAEYGDSLTASLSDTSFFYVVNVTQLGLLFGGLLLIVSVLVILFHRRSTVVDYNEIPLYVQDGKSAGQDHDLNLKQDDAK